MNEKNDNEEKDIDSDEEDYEIYCEYLIFVILSNPFKSTIVNRCFRISLRD